MLVDEQAPTERVLATRASRFWASLLDSLIGIVVLVIVAAPTDLVGKIQSGELTLVDQAIFAVATFVGYLLIQGYPLAKRGQSLGKIAMSVQIVSIDDGRILPFWKLIGLRVLPLTLASQIPILGNLVGIVDALFIFREDRRCVHDYIASTKVVQYES